MKKRKTESFIFYARVYDNPEVPIHTGDLQKGIKSLAVRMGKLATFPILKRRRENPSVSARRKAKRVKSLKRKKQREKEGRL